MDVHEEGPHKFEPRIVASHDVENSSSFNPRHCHLSPDGTTLLTTSVSEPSQTSTIETIILPPDLLTSSSIQSVDVFSVLDVPEPVRATAPYTYFDLSDASTTLLLVSLPDHPIRLMNGLSFDSGIVASYSYIYPETEEYIAPHSLHFTNDGTRFLAGADSEVSVFDLSRSSNGAIERYKFGRSSHPSRSKQWRMKRGIVSTLDTSVDGVLAVGTFTREIGLYWSYGQECVATFELDDRHRGAGISQLTWSPCGRYLLISERKSNVIRVYDVRGEHRLLQTLIGCHADSMLRLSWDVTANGEVWAGDMSGKVNIWDGIGMSEGDKAAMDSWQAHEDVVLSTKVHACGSVVITTGAKDRNSDSSRELHGIKDTDSEESSSSSSMEESGGCLRVNQSIKMWRV